ncbi:MAG: protein-L-isoaspartate(D-aspartate) O-methyltransferase, partial [Alphaproteobacteria bacterium]
MSTDAHKIRLIMELRREGISDTRVLSAIEQVPREIFVPDNFRDQAYRNTALPIGGGQTISQPLIVAEMTVALALNDRLRVLEIGTGSGYQAAILAKLARRVYTIERHRELMSEAEARFDALKLRNITTRVGDGSKGWPELAPWERILVTAAAPDIPPVLADQLAVGGHMVVPVGGEGEEQHILRVTRTETGFETEKLWAVRFVPLVAGMPDE